MSTPPLAPSRPEPRIAPGSTAEIGRVNAAICWTVGKVAGNGPPNIFTTLARHRSLFRAWLRFAAALMPRGTLPRADTELVILRVAHNCACDYEWGHHERIAPRVGLQAAQVEAVRTGAEAFSGRQAVLIQAADELHQNRVISDELWEQLRAELAEVELIELCMLIGHYEMLAMTLNSLRVQPEVRR